MKQYEAVIKVMEEKGGFATLGQLYQDVLKVPDCTWKTKTPLASIRRIVQDSRFFFKIKPGLWALNSHKVKVLKNFEIATKVQKKQELFNHSYYQGLLVEVGNLMGLKTFVPNQDKNKKYLETPLKNMTSLKEIFNFTYSHLVNRVSTIDVTWFNERNMPCAFFEVEHTTDIYKSLNKFMELQDFNTKLYIVADKFRYRQFYNFINSTTYKPILGRVNFRDYETISSYHTKLYAFAELRNVFLF